MPDSIECPKCGKRIVARYDGGLRVHGPRDRRCPGTGLVPYGDDDSAKWADQILAAVEEAVSQVDREVADDLAKAVALTAHERDEIREVADRLGEALSEAVAFLRAPIEQQAANNAHEALDAYRAAKGEA